MRRPRCTAFEAVAAASVALARAERALSLAKRHEKQRGVGRRFAVTARWDIAWFGCILSPSPVAVPRRRERTVWSRATRERAGAATPLTWSVARGFSDAGFRAAFESLGCRVPKDAILISNVYGRFYLNLSAFMSIAGQVPGLSPRALLEQSGGAPDGIIRALHAEVERSHTGFLMRAPFTLPGLLKRGLRLEREVDAWEVDADDRDGSSPSST